MGYWNQGRDYFQAARCSLTTTRAKQNLLRRNKNAESMNADIHLEDRAGSSQGKHEGEPSLGLCDRLDRTRDNSQRQLPTDHDYAVPTREYQTDQSSLTTAPTAARSVFGKRKRKPPKQTHRSRPVDTVTPYQGNALIELQIGLRLRQVTVKPANRTVVRYGRIAETNVFCNEPTLY